MLYHYNFPFEMAVLEIQNEAICVGYIIYLLLNFITSLKFLYRMLDRRLKLENSESEPALSIAT